MTDKAREEFEEWFSRTWPEPDMAAHKEKELAFMAWQASRAAMQEIAEKAYMAGWEESGEGWNAEYPGDAHEKESFATRRNQAFESFGLLKVAP